MTPAICFLILCALTLSRGHLLALGDVTLPQAPSPKTIQVPDVTDVDVHTPLLSLFSKPHSPLSYHVCNHIPTVVC